MRGVFIPSQTRTRFPSLAKQNHSLPSSPSATLSDPSGASYVATCLSAVAISTTIIITAEKTDALRCMLCDHPACPEADLLLAAVGGSRWVSLVGPRSPGWVMCDCAHQASSLGSRQLYTPGHQLTGISNSCPTGGSSWLLLYPVLTSCTNYPRNTSTSAVLSTLALHPTAWIPPTQARNTCLLMFPR